MPGRRVFARRAFEVSRRGEASEAGEHFAPIDGHVSSTICVDHWVSSLATGSLRTYVLTLLCTTRC
jgi:hypothetical protein